MQRGESDRDLMTDVQWEAVGRRAASWTRARSDLAGWSASQRKELEMYGVTGSLALPDGPGELWPVLAAARWMHLGKGTVLGMGQLQVAAVP